MFSEPGETPDHPVEPSGHGERERRRHTEREICDSSPSKRQIPPIFCSLDVPWKMKSFVKVNHKNATVPHMVFLLLPLSCLSGVWLGVRARLYFGGGWNAGLHAANTNNRRSCVLYAYARASDKDVALPLRSSIVGK